MVFQVKSHTTKMQNFILIKTYKTITPKGDNIGKKSHE